MKKTLIFMLMALMATAMLAIGCAKEEAAPEPAAAEAPAVEEAAPMEEGEMAEGERTPETPDWTRSRIRERKPSVKLRLRTLSARSIRSRPSFHLPFTYPRERFFSFTNRLP